MEIANFQPGGVRYPIYAGQRVFVYRNLNRMRRGARPVFSIQSRETIITEGFSPLTYGKVFHHTHDVLLKDCTFVVSQSGWRRVRDTGVKNVHAGIIGTLVQWQDIEALHGETIRYNPMIAPHFLTADGQVVGNAHHVRIHGFQSEDRWSSVIVGIFRS